MRENLQVFYCNHKDTHEQTHKIMRTHFYIFILRIPLLTALTLLRPILFVGMGNSSKYYSTIRQMHTERKGETEFRDRVLHS